MKHNQNEEASKQHEKGTSHQKQMPKNQDSNGRSTQHGPSNRSQSDDNDQQIGKQGSKKHAGTGKSK